MCFDCGQPLSVRGELADTAERTIQTAAQFNLFTRTRLAFPCSRVISGGWVHICALVCLVCAIAHVCVLSQKAEGVTEQICTGRPTSALCCPNQSQQWNSVAPFSIHLPSSRSSRRNSTPRSLLSTEQTLASGSLKHR